MSFFRRYSLESLIKIVGLLEILKAKAHAQEEQAPSTEMTDTMFKL